jgi:hypothetical protein
LRRAWALDALLGHRSHRLSVNTYGVSNDDLWAFGDDAFWEMGKVISLVWHKGLAIAQGMPWEEAPVPGSSLVNTVPNVLELTQVSSVSGHSNGNGNGAGNGHFAPSSAPFRGIEDPEDLD